MKSILAMLFFTIFCVGQKVNFVSDIDVAFEQAKAEHKLVFIEYYNSQCTICISIQPLFENALMADFYNSNFINYKINTRNGLTSKDSLFMAERKLKFTGVPYFLFFDEDKNFVHYANGKNDLDHLISIGKKAMLPEERTGSLAQKYASGDRSIRTLYAYSDLVQLYEDDALNNTISDELFHVYPKERLGTNQSYLILKNAVFSIDNGFYTYWYENRANLKDFEKGSHKGTEAKALERILLLSIQKEKGKWDLEKIRKVKEMTLELGISKDRDAFLWEEEAQALLQLNQHQEAVVLFKTLIGKNKDNIYSSLFITEKFISFFSKKEDLAVVVEELEGLKILEMEKEQKGDLLYQQYRCYQKMKDDSKTAEFKKVVVNYYKQNGLDLSTLDEL
jgi:thiol-disulfide isomerase/thioredoxin